MAAEIKRRRALRFRVSGQASSSPADHPSAGVPQKHPGAPVPLPGGTPAFPALLYPFLCDGFPSKPSASWVMSPLLLLLVCVCSCFVATCVELSHSLYALHQGHHLITKCVCVCVCAGPSHLSAGLFRQAWEMKVGCVLHTCRGICPSLPSLFLKVCVCTHVCVPAPAHVNLPPSFVFVEPFPALYTTPSKLSGSMTNLYE